MLMAALLAGACSDDVEQDSADVRFCVRAAWQNGLGGGTTRALSATDILSDATGDIVIGTADYPTTISAMCMKDGVQVGEEFTLTKGSSTCAEHGNDYWQYVPSVMYKDKKIVRENYKFYFTATIDPSADSELALDDELIGTATKDNIRGSHMLVTLHHTKALLRFAFKVSEKYDKIRFIKVTRIKLNSVDCYVKEAVLAKDKQTYIAYAYVDPVMMTIDKENSIQCTYNIYDRDDATADHLTREGVTARNTFKFNALKDAYGNSVSSIRAGYYYDLNVTLNPDYLYVMTEHDNKHIKIE